MGTPDPRLSRERTDLLHGLKHLVRRAFEQIADGASEDCIAGKQVAAGVVACGEEVGYMPSCMTGHFQNNSLRATDDDFFAFVKGGCLAGDPAAIARTAKNWNAGKALYQNPVPANMVSVVVSDEDRSQPATSVPQVLKDRPRVARIDNSDLLRGLILQQEDVIVCESSKRCAKHWQTVAYPFPDHQLEPTPICQLLRPGPLESTPRLAR